MKHNRTLMICATILLIGLVNAWIFNKELEKFNRSFNFKDFYSNSSPSTPSVPPTVVTLSPSRFVVVDDSKISVYQVDGKGKISRTADVSSNYEELQPARRY